MGKAKDIRWTSKEGAAPNAKRALPALVSAYFARVRETLTHQPTLGDLHGVRLLTKRLRYTLELFRPCYGPGLRERLAELRRIQQCLGDLNDCVTAKALVANFSPPGSPVRQNFDRFLDQRSLSLLDNFRREWTDVFDAPGQEIWWTRYLARHARQPVRK